jgi:hypothetical protein
MLIEQDSQEDGVRRERFLERFGDDRKSNRPSLQCQLLGRAAARDGHVDVVTRKGVSEGLTYLAEPNNCVAHKFLRYLLVLLSR